MKRRGFLTMLGAAALAPLFIPSDRLALGVPRLPASLRAPQPVDSGLVLDEASGARLHPLLAEEIERSERLWEAVRSFRPLDDAARLQTMIDRVTSGGVAHIPPGEYRLTRPIRVPADVSLVAPRLDIEWAGESGRAHVMDIDCPRAGGSPIVRRAQREWLPS